MGVKKIILCLCCSFSMIMSAQQKITKTLGDFTSVKAFDGLSIELVSSDKNMVEITGQFTDDVSIVNKNGLLKVRMKIKRIFNGYNTFVKLYHKSPIELVDVNENAKVTSENTIKRLDLELKAQEGGEIKVPVEVQRLDVKSVTGGIIETSGVAKNQDVSVNTGGVYEADLTKTEQTTIVVNAGGTAHIFASEYVEAKVKAGGTIRVYGNPKVLEKQVFIGGKIIEE